MRYPKDIRDTALRRVLPPTNDPVMNVASEFSIGPATLRRWRREALRRPTIGEPGFATAESQPENKPQPLRIPEDFARVVIIFKTPASLPYTDYIDAQPPLSEKKLGDWKQLVQACNGSNVVLERLLTSVSSDRIAHLADSAAESYRRIFNEEPPSFLSYFAVSCPPGIDPADIANIARSWPGVDNAYVEAQAALSEAQPPPAQDNIILQKYLGPASESGIDAAFANRMLGGSGEGTKFVDIEQGWEFDANHQNAICHKDFPPGIRLHSGCNHNLHGHGTACLGIVIAQGVRCLGIASKAEATCISEYRSVDGRPGFCIRNIADAIEKAIEFFVDNSPPGSDETKGVLLVESQVTRDGNFLPVEIDPAILEAIRKATASGVVVVEPAGNGNPYLDLDNDPSMPAADSGAILVGAVDSNTGEIISNYGSRRVHCFAWGNNVSTTGSGFSSGPGVEYTPDFGGTSAAAAIIAGAALVILGIARANNLRLTPAKVRDLLRNRSNPRSPASPRGTARAPDLRSIIERHMPAAQRRPD